MRHACRVNYEDRQDLLSPTDVLGRATLDKLASATAADLNGARDRARDGSPRGTTEGARAVQIWVAGETDPATGAPPHALSAGLDAALAGYRTAQTILGAVPSELRADDLVRAVKRMNVYALIDADIGPDTDMDTYR